MAGNSSYPEGAASGASWEILSVVFSLKQSAGGVRPDFNRAKAMMTVVVLDDDGSGAR